MTRKRIILFVAGVVVVACSVGVAAALRQAETSSSVSGHEYVIEVGQGSTERLLIVRDGRVVRSLAAGTLSPDRKVLVMDDWSGQLWVAVGSGRRHRLLSVGSTYSEGEGFWDWTPRGHRLVARSGPRIFVVDAVTGRRTDVTPTSDPAAVFLEPRWSPTGSLIAYARTSTTDNAYCCRVEIGVAPAIGGRFRTLAVVYRDRGRDAVLEFDAIEQALVNTAFTSWSPDGRTLVAAGSPAPSGYPTLRLIEVDTGRVHEFRDVQLRGSVAWSPDGRSLAVEAQDRTVVAVRADGGGTRVATRDFDPAEGSSLAWSPDGRRLAVAGRRRTIVTVGADGKDVRTVTSGDSVLHWWPDGTIAVVRRTTDSFWELVEANDETDSAVQLVLRARGVISLPD